MRTRNILRLQLAAAVIAALANTTMAQQAPARPAPPQLTEDLGVVGIGDTVVSADWPITNGQNLWFKITLNEGITPSTWLNIDTARSYLSNGSGLNTEIGMYNDRAYIVEQDDYSGGGTTLSNSTASALSFGGGSGERLGSDGQPGWFGSRIDVGWNQWRVGADDANGRLRPYAGPGTYYIVVVGFDADFSQNPNPNWQISTNFVGAGTVRLRIRTGNVPSTTWNELHHGYDSGYSPATAQVVRGSGPLTNILGIFYPGERDIYKIRICDPATFSARATLTLSWGNTYRGTMFLLDADGRGVLGINNTISGSDTVLTVPSGTNLAVGDYYLAISSYCGGNPGSGWQHVPYDANDQALWNFTGSGNWNVSIPPNGTGQANPMAYSGIQSDCETNSDIYFVRLALSGACYVEAGPAPCAPDLNRDGVIGLQDLAILLSMFGSVCP